jgi:two-component system copper resistance phosphate regulon response regulator CusR
MEYFLKNIGMILTRTQILEDVWDMNICCATNTIDVHVSRLRKKLKNLFKKDLIKTVHCIGYLFGE